MHVRCAMRGTQMWCGEACGQNWCLWAQSIPWATSFRGASGASGSQKAAFQILIRRTPGEQPAMLDRNSIRPRWPGGQAVPGRGPLPPTAATTFF